MGELINKLSNYNIFNYLFPGVIVCYCLEKLSIYNIFHKEIIVNAFICYFVGLCISRISSLIIEPILIKTKILPREDYKKYIEASKIDNKIEFFSEISNSYRTLMISLLVIPIINAFMIYPNKWQANDWKILIVFVLLSILFLLSHIKQNSYVIKRINNALNNKETK
ncbi:hypothetical protein OLP60_02120 [Campylobacter jejuni]|nr:hypothetical protein [Campylobacter jejuni]MCW1687095.1 hypothetical protein [Campylobacter jejuni]MCW1691785.1 hypothetical protein [Campylobacter jejuni]